MKKPRKRKAWRVWRRIISICATLSLFVIAAPFVLLAVIASKGDDEIISIPTLNSFIEDKVAENSDAFEIEMSAGGLSKGDSFFKPQNSCSKM